MKKILSMLLAFVLLLSLVPVTAFATETPTITATASTTEAVIGDTVEVTFTLANNPGFTNIEMQLDFDKNVLQFTGLKTTFDENSGEEVYEGRFSTGTEVNTTINAEKYGYIAHARSSSSSPDGKLFVAQFTVIGAGNTTVDADIIVFDNDETSYASTITVTPSASITVAGTPATSVTLDKTELSLEEGENYLLTATVEPTDTTDEVVWSSSNESVATVLNGQVKAVSAGTTTITAKANDTAYAECAVTVTAEQSVVGKSANSYGDWDETAALTGIKSMTLGGETKTIKNIYKLTLEGHEEFYLRAVGGIMSVGYKLDGSSYIGDPWGTDMSAQGVNYSWAGIHTKDLLVSYGDLVAAVGESNASKLGVSEDDTLAFLYVKNPDAYNYGILFKIDAPPEATSISIPEILEVTVGNDSTLTASLEPNGTEADITWTSTDTNIATVDENGKVTGVANGTTTITATITTSAGTLSDTCTVTVATAIANIPSNGDYSGSLNSITIGGVSIEDYSWSGQTLNVYVPASTNTTAQVRFDWTHSYNQSGSETVDITITNGVGTYSGFTTHGNWVINFAVRTPATGISLDKTETEIRIGDNETLTATISPEDSTDTITWTSSDTSIAKVNGSGMVTAVAAGEATITASAGDYSAECKVTVYTVPAISVTISGEGIENGKLRLLKGNKLTPTITIEPENTTDAVSYAIEDTTVATVSARTGRINSKNEGKTNYTVTVGGVSATLEVEVYGIHAESLTLDNSMLSMNYGDSVTLTATVLPEGHTDGSVTWESSDTSVVTVDNGTVKAVGGGTATVTATLGSLSAKCDVTVAEPYKVTDNLPTLADPYGYSVKMDYVYITGAEVESVSWDGLTCNVTLKEGTADGTSVKAIAHVSAGYMGSKDFSGSGTLADGACAVTVTCSEWWMESTNLVFNFTVTESAEPEQPVSNPITEIEISHPGIVTDETTGTMTMAMVTGASEQINVSTVLENAELKATQVVAWSSSDPEVATVENGKVTALKAGSTVITAKAVEPSDVAAAAEGDEVMAQFTLTVSDPAAGYTVTMGRDVTASAGDPITIPITVNHTNNEDEATDNDVQNYKSYEFVFQYETDLLTLVTGSSEDEAQEFTVVDESGTVTLRRYGNEKNVGEAAVTLEFTANKTGVSDVKLTSAKIGTSDDAQDEDIPVAAIIDNLTKITVTGYDVDLDEAFTGAGVADPEKDYTFEAKDKNYVYTVDVTVTKPDGTEETFEVTDEDEDGSLTIPADKITGSIRIEVDEEKTAGKTFNVSIEGTGKSAFSGAETAQYKADYKLTPTEGYDLTGYTIQYKIGETEKDMPANYTIPGDEITGDITITVTAPVDPENPDQPANTWKVTFDGNGAADVALETNPVYVAKGQSLSFTINKADGYTYIVTSTDATSTVELTAAEDGIYTITPASDVTIKVMKWNVEVNQYVALNGKTVFLVSVAEAENVGLKYDGNAMYVKSVNALGENGEYTGEASDKYVYLVELAGGTLTVEDAARKLNIVENVTCETVALDYNVNESSNLDINDAQLVYDMYNNVYESIATVGMKKFLRADIGGDRIVNVQDAIAVVTAILTPQA